MRRFSGISIGAWVGVELYLTLVPLLTTVPRWMFEASRLVLLAAGAVALTLTVLTAARNFRQLRGPTFNWFVLALAAASLCLLRWLARTFPLFA